MCRKASGKKIGRPLTDSGNPDEPGLRDDERRRIRRRMANRESARRVRERRVEAKAKMEARVHPSLQPVKVVQAASLAQLADVQGCARHGPNAVFVSMTNSIC